MNEIRIRLGCWKKPVLMTLSSLVLTFSLDGRAELTGSVTGATDYLWRGYTKSNGSLVGQVNIDYQFRSGIYLGSFFSTVNFADHGFKDRSSFELRPYLGYAHTLSDDWRANVAWTRYIYDGKIFDRVADYNEFYFFLHFRDLLTANVNFSENGYNQNHMSFSTEITGRYPISDAVEISGGVGFNKQKKILEYDYVYWNSGVTVHFSRNIGIDIRYFGSEEAGTASYQSSPAAHWEFHPHHIGHRAVFSITFGF